MRPDDDADDYDVAGDEAVDDPRLLLGLNDVDVNLDVALAPTLGGERRRDRTRRGPAAAMTT